MAGVALGGLAWSMQRRGDRGTLALIAAAAAVASWFAGILLAGSGDSVLVLQQGLQLAVVVVVVVAAAIRAGRVVVAAGPQPPRSMAAAVEAAWWAGVAFAGMAATGLTGGATGRRIRLCTGSARQRLAGRGRRAAGVVVTFRRAGLSRRDRSPIVVSHGRCHPR